VFVYRQTEDELEANLSLLKVQTKVRTLAPPGVWSGFTSGHIVRPFSPC